MKNRPLTLNEKLSTLKWRAQETLWEMEKYEKCSRLALPMSLLKEIKDKALELKKEYNELLDEVTRLETGPKYYYIDQCARIFPRAYIFDTEFEELPRFWRKMTEEEYTEFMKSMEEEDDLTSIFY